MSDFKDFFATKDTFVDGIEGTDYSWVDADTLRDSQDNRFRLQGIDAPEITKVDPNTGQPVHHATAGAGVATPEIMKLANENGFTNVIKSGEKDPYGREIIRLQDSRGRDFNTEILKSGILQTNRYTNRDDVVSAEVGKILRSRDAYEDTQWDQARASIQDAISSETLYDAGFKEQRITEADPGSGSVQFRKYDRSLDNKALNPLSESFDVGLVGAREALYGSLELIGEKSDWDWAKDVGEGGIARARAQLADKPTLKLSALDDEGNWDIDSVGEFFEYVGNNAAISLPYMAATIGGALAAPYTAGLSLAAPVSIYTGQVWNEMEGENRSASIAIAAGVSQAVLDRIGLAGIVSGSILKKETRDAAINHLVTQNNITKKQASNILADLTRKELAQVVGDVGKVASQQLSARNVARAFSQRAAVGAGTEAVTEGLQESIGYTAAALGSEGGLPENWDANEYVNRILNATLAGGTLGASFSAPGTLYDTGAWTDLAVRQSPAEQKRAAQSAKWARDETQQFGRVKSVQELNEENTGATNARKDSILTFNERVEAHKKKSRETDIFDKGKELWAAVPGLWRGATRHIFNQDLQSRSRAARKLADMFGGNLQKIFSGAHFENRKHHLLTEYKNSVPDPLQIAENLGFKGFRGKTGTEISNIMNGLGEFIKSQEGNASIDWDALPPELANYRQFLGAYYNQYKALGDKMWSDQSRHNPDLGYINNYLFHYKGFNKEAIEKNRDAFIEALVNKGMDRHEAQSITDEILHADSVNSIDDFSVGRGKNVPGSHKARTLNLADDPHFNDFMEQNFFNNLSNAAKSAARYVAYQEFLGDNNAKVNELLQQMLDEGIGVDEVNKIAAQMQDYLDAESGNYKRIKSPHWNKIQQNLLLWTAIAGLPLATISSFVELALTSRALTKDQIFGNIKNASLQGAQGMWDALKVFDNQTNRNLAKRNRQSDLQDLGYFNWEVGAATTTGVTQAGHTKQRWLDFYFKAIGLQQWTDYTRNVRAAMAGDYIGSKLDIINDQRQNGGLYTNEVQEAEEQVRNLGINIDDMLTIMNTPGQLSDAEAQSIADNMREGMFNFVNEAVALPQAGNRPLFYQNPHLALFTQFQGFIATFTANHIPKMWNELVSRGTPSMKYNAFAVMTTMIALGFASQYLKDLLKYGKPSPYLDDAEKFQRAIGASGLTGTGERIINFFNPIYEQQTDGPVDWFFTTVAGESAAVSNLTRAGTGLTQLPSDPQKGAYNILKTTPFFGPFNQGNRFIADAIFGG